jgi:hypothetical protein
MLGLLREIRDLLKDLRDVETVTMANLQQLNTKVKRIEDTFKTLEVTAAPNALPPQEQPALGEANGTH